MSMFVSHSSRCCVILLALGSACSADLDARVEQSPLTAEQCMYFAPTGRVVICHATSSGTKPYVILRLDDDGCIEDHVDHAGDYVTTEADPTCHGDGCLPSGAPCEAGAELACCDGLTCTDGLCTPQVDPTDWQVVIGNGITIDSIFEHGPSGQIKGGGQFTAPSLEKMGACLLHKVYVNEEPVECDSASQCAQYLPTGDAWTKGFYYCQEPYNSKDNKSYCYVKQASSRACVGSPALGATPIPEGTYYTDWHNATDYPYSSNASGARGYTFMVGACYQACSATPPSNSIESTYVPVLDRWLYR